MKGPFEARQEVVADHVHRYVVSRSGRPIPYAEILTGWQHDAQFRAFFGSLLAGSPFTAYRWETPPLATDTASRGFEFVLLDSPGLATRPDPQTYEEYFTDDNVNEGVVAFENLGRDAVLVVPSPRGPDSAYGHLAAFLRGAPDAQIHALWRTVGATIEKQTTDRPLWVSTAGGGVAWLHVRLDSRPKYYGHSPYKLPT